MIDILFLLLWWSLFLLSPLIPLSYKTWWYMFLSLFLVIMGGMIIRCYYANTYPEGEMQRDSVVRVGPHETYGVCGTIKAKDKVVICESCGDWKQIQKVSPTDWFCIKGGIRGWISRDDVIVACVKP